MGNYPEFMVAPIRQDLVTVGFEQLLSPEEVDKTIHDTKGTVLLCVNSVCGCAAGRARPAIKQAIQHAKKPNKLVTVFAGMEQEATAKAREYMAPYPPSSPSIALFKDGKLVHMIERHQIESAEVQMIVDNLVGAFEEHCG